VSDEDELARQEAMKFADRHVPMALEHPEPESSPGAENPGLSHEDCELVPDPVIKGSWWCRTHGEGRLMLLGHEPAEAVAPVDVAELPSVRMLLAAEPALVHEAAPAPVPQPPVKKKRSARMTPEEKAAKAAERAAERERKKAERAAERLKAKNAEKAEKIREAEGGWTDLPAVVLRDGTVRHVSDKDAWAVIEMYLEDLCLDCETSGYPLGHRLYELRTVQAGGEKAAIVFDASSPGQMEIASLALTMAGKLRAHSATADIIPCVAAGLIGWDQAWAKTQDSVLNAKLNDPKMSGSDADALKALAADLLREYAVSPKAEEDKNALFREMGCLVDTTLTTPPEKNGWYRVNPNSVVMTRYAGSDVLDLAAVLRVLPPVPVTEAVMDREREFQAACASVTWTGFALDAAHIKAKIAGEEAAREEAAHNVLVLSDGKITNPKSPAVIKLLPEVIPGIELGVNRKTKRVSADKGSLEKVARTDDPLTHHLVKQILAYRHHDTTLGLLLRPLENLCDYGDGRMRPTVYTIEASTGRTSCRRPNGQQFSRQGGVRACVTAGTMTLELVGGQWEVVPGAQACEMRGISADFEGCEIRVAAALSGDAGLYEAEVSTFCYYCREDPCGCGKRHLGLHWRTAHGAHKQDATKEHRYMAKRGTFTRLFGGGPETAADQVGAEVKDMQAIFAAFDENAPEFTAWDKWMRQCYKEGSMVWRDYATGTNYSQPIDGVNRMIYQTYSGRPVYIANGAHAAGNGAIQGTARELLVDGTLRWRRTRWGHLPLLPVHDQIIAFVPGHEAREATAALAGAMETTVLSSPGFEIRIGADVDEPFVSWPDSS
jgi:DNA polymerase I-like protein with 3'-5' exonuclease and polymerase domains